MAQRLKQNFNEVQAILDAVGQKVDKVEGKGLSTNDYTDTDKAKLSGIQAGAQANVIERIKRNGVALSPIDKEVDINVPTSLSNLSDDESHRTVTDTEKETWSGKQNDISGIIPQEASSSNKLADKNYVNDAVTTASADFKGTFESVAELPATGMDKNDYAYVVSSDAAGNTVYDRYKYNGSAWVFEYSISSPTFSSSEWATIRSGMTEELRRKLENIPAGAEANVQPDWNQDNSSADDFIKNKPDDLVHYEEVSPIDPIDVPQYALEEEVSQLRSDVDVLESRFGDSRFRSMPVAGIDTTGAYIYASTGKWATSSAADSYMLPIIPGRRYYIRAFTKSGRIAVLTTNTVTVGSVPSYANGYSSYVDIAAGESYSFTAPYNAAYMCVHTKLSSNSVRPSFILEEMSAEETLEAVSKSYEAVSGCPSRYVDAVTSSTTFGMSVAATSSDWGAGNPVCVRGFKKVRYYANIFSTSSNYYGKAGSVFYDKNFDPITDVVQIIRQAGTALVGWYELDVPANAWYFRQTYNTVDAHEIYLISDSNEGSMTYKDSEAQKAGVYFGEKIDLVGNSFDFVRFTTNGVANTQGAAAYGDYLFMAKDELSQIIVYNLKTRTVLYTLTTGITSQSYWHCNQLSFSSKFYDENDPFPVLYFSMQNNGDGRCEAHGYRITPTYTDGEISAISITLVQTILLPVMTDINCLGNANVTFDTQNGWMWTYSRNKNDQAANYGKAKFTRFAIPELTSATVTLEDTDILESFGEDWEMAYAQGGFIQNGKLVIVQGYSSVGYINLHVIDLYLEKRRVSWIDMKANGFSMEPEGPFWYDGKIHFTTATVHMYRIDL